MKEQQELSAEKKRKPAAPKKTAPAPPKLKLLVTVVNREKADLYAALLQGFDINFQLTMAAYGTANTEVLRVLGLAESDKSVIFSVVREDRAAAALRFLEEKFATIKNGKGIAYTVPLTGTIGVSIYQFLSNNS
ncbi:MAG: hypothetical protein IKV00_05220 [Clostridia bacterium]|nr:hypothetical protein [Clostridia bacterium]